MDHKPQGRNKKVGNGSVSVGKGRRVGTGGPVGGGQGGRPSVPGGGSFPPSGGNRGGGPQRASGGGKGAGALGLLALFAFLPKKLRAPALIIVAAILLFSFCSNGSGSQAPAVPSYTISPASDGVENIDDAGMLFSSAGMGSFFDPYGMFGAAGGSYSGSSPTGGTTASGSGGLLQDLPGTAPSTPAPTPKPTATPRPSVTSTPLVSEARAKRVTPLGGGRDSVTVMIYMCGTDLESRYGMATSDLSEMVKADLADNVNVIVLTGGCKSWKNSVMSNSVNQIYRVRSGGLERLEENFGRGSMVEADTLSGFIRYCASNYPANRNFLIFWDHGGGSISGFGYDERNQAAGSMPLTKIDKALSDAGVVFDWIGYDACLMSTLETAQVSARYADYLIASEEVEPGTGWYYTDWLNALSRNTSISTPELGKLIIDSYVNACRQRSYSAQVTLALTDLAELEGRVPALFRSFSVATNELIGSDDYRQVSNARAGARQFAQSTRINQVDLTDLALRIDTAESRALAEALQRCVVYNGTTISRCYGLSIYFPYETLSSVSTAVNTYDALGLDAEYARVIKSFASLEYGGQVGSSAAQSGYGNGSSGSYGSYGDLLGALFGSYSSGSSGSYGSSSPYGSLSGGYTNASGQSAAGYGIDVSDLAGLFSAFSGRSMPAGLEWVDTQLIADSAETLAEGFLDPGRITVSYAGGRPVLALTPEEWSLVQSIELNVFADDGAGYIDLGFDNVFEFDGDSLLLDYDNTWLTLDGQLAAFYVVSAAENPDGSLTTVGRIPALLNGALVNLQVVFDAEHPDGAVTGAYPFYQNGETETAPKGLVPLRRGDTLELLCDYYGYDGSYGASYALSEVFTLDGEPELINLTLDSDALIPSYRITDIYGNIYWLTF